MVGDGPRSRDVPRIEVYRIITTVANNGVQSLWDNGVQSLWEKMQ